MGERGYLNQFEEVRDKVAAFKARTREMNRTDEELRERRSRRAAEEELDSKPKDIFTTPTLAAERGR